MSAVRTRAVWQDGRMILPKESLFPKEYSLIRKMAFYIYEGTLNLDNFGTSLP